MRVSRLTRIGLTAVSLATSSSAADLWVDPAGGSDLAAGTTPSTPLKTLSEAVDRAASGDCVFLYRGDYTAATGESFPVHIPAGVRLQSLEGASATNIDVRLGSANYARAFVFEPNAVLMGVTVHGRDDAELLAGPSPVQSPPRVLGCTLIGGEHVLYSEGGAFEFADSVMRGQRYGSVSLASGASSAGRIHVRLAGCRLEGSQNGVVCSVAQFAPHLTVELDRCSVVGQAGAGVLVVTAGGFPPTVALRGCLLASNYIGLQAYNFNQGGRVELTVEHCTIVDHTEHGLETSVNWWAPSVIHSTIVARNGHADVDIDSGNGLVMQNCLVEDGTGVPGVDLLWGAPGFVDASAGDYSLRFDSPCLDFGLRTPTLSPADLRGTPRSLDSDLDFLARPDAGALEHAPLEGPAAIRLGQPATFGLSGQAGGFSTLIVAPGGLAASPISGTFGRLVVEPAGAFRLAPVMTTGGDHTALDLAPAIDPSWVGTTIGLQALTRSDAAPFGGAFTNAQLVEVR